MLGPSGAPRRPLLHSSVSPRPRTQGRRPHPRYQRWLLVAFAALPGPPFDHSWALLSHSRFDERGPRFRINYRSACPYPESFRRVTYYTYTHTRAARFQRGRIDFKEPREGEKERGILLARDYGWLLQWYSVLAPVGCRCSLRLLLLPPPLPPPPPLRARFSCLDSTSFLGARRGARAFRGTQASRNLWRTTDRCHEIHRCCCCCCNTHAAAHAKQVCLCAR